MNFWQAWRTGKVSFRKNWWDLIVIYLIPQPIWARWMRWVHHPIKFHYLPWNATSACETCPVCQEIEASRR